MPCPNKKIPEPLREGLMECFEAVVALAPPEQRSQLVLRTEDIDIAAPASVISVVLNAIIDGTAGFTLESDAKVAYDCIAGFRIRVDFLEIGAGIIDQIHGIQPLGNGSVASLADLMLLRATTVIYRGDDGDIWDLQWLFSEVARSGVLLPPIGEEELQNLCRAGERCLGKCGLLFFAAILGEGNPVAASKLLDI
ncbi:unnamed protein product [Clonostachys rosea]|uniref:Uncharacterized protein n=1 Tax=Bionectria ochroleuca TaxID=29856 RepID=A0ABY6TS44_BIOOC|nr:unnamed protein product [Clonostachys rosea]